MPEARRWPPFLDDREPYERDEVAMSQLRQARATQTRNKIIRAAAEDFCEFGFLGASMSRIVRRSGTTMGAVYFHFSSKQELARTVMAEQDRDLAFPPGEDGLQRLVDINMFLAHQMRTDILFRAGVRLAVEQGHFGLRESAPYELWIGRFHEQLKAAADRGELLPGVDTAGFARVLVSAYTGTQLVSLFMTNREDLAERIAQMWHYLLPGIASPDIVSQLDLTTALSTENA